MATGTRFIRSTVVLAFDDIPDAAAACVAHGPCPEHPTRKVVGIDRRGGTFVCEGYNDDEPPIAIATKHDLPKLWITSLEENVLTVLDRETNTPTKYEGRIAPSTKDGDD